mmetsp:Transcript_31939/g.55031  ORF Transcript_31939/g.55031 Transcript_31939/m.55031 type:complete len:178 (-) Transcript_31939:152-685(-)
MLTKRSSHASTYYKGYLFVIGGYSTGGALRECERFDASEESWDVLPWLPHPSIGLTAVVFEPSECLYAFGGYSKEEADTFQELNLSKLRWRDLRVRLPSKLSRLACFMSDEDSSCIYIVLEDTLLALKPLTEELEEIKPISNDTTQFSRTNFYRNGVLYCSNEDNLAPCQVYIGSLQ